MTEQVPEAAPGVAPKEGRAIKRKVLPYNVVQGARKRIINAFSNGVPVYFSISGGKDSICLAHLTLSLIEEGRIDPSLLTVTFVDEEAMHEPVIKIVHDWRKKFRLSGARFDWYCIEVRHFNCFNALEQDESFICWDSTVPDRWVRKMPSFAITDHPMLRRRQDTYQDFLSRIQKDGISMAGLRTAESLQRLLRFREYDAPEHQLFSPIYDWKDADVWRYIADHDLDFPETYLHLYQIGFSRKEMRLSQFFSIDTAKVLVRLGEHEPDLMERVTRREPNAYLAALYWDTELFRSTNEEPAPVTADGADGTDAEAPAAKDWRAECGRLLRSMERGTHLQRKLARQIRNETFKWSYLMDDKDWRKVYAILVAGDPKFRSIRALENYLGKKGSIVD